MTGARIMDQQVTIYKNHRTGNSQVVAAAKAGISERSARRIDKSDQQHSDGHRRWRTRKDPRATRKEGVKTSNNRRAHGHPSTDW